MIAIREAGAFDFELLASLGRRAFYEAFGAFNDPADMQTYLDLAFNSEQIKGQLLDRQVTYLIAAYNESPVGYAKLKRGSTVPELNGQKVIQLERIYALQDYIGKKVGKHLMEECIVLAEREGFEKLWLSVWQQNSKAIEFYHKFGFEVIGYKQFTIGKEINDDFVMALRLTRRENETKPPLIF